MALHESNFFLEKSESKIATCTCSKCGHRDDYQVRWIKRTKKDKLPSGADEHDRAVFGKLRNYFVRVDDVLTCNHCRRKFEIPSQQSVAFF
jgi:hypothetical protein